jgi:ectoine hydroxylase-related dioxygenase (phytanoyl-CoA dioxygenase family)
VDDALTELADVSERIKRNGYVVLPARLDDEFVARARDELGELLATAAWGTGFDGTRTRRVWAPLAVTRCMDRAALDGLTLGAVEQILGPGAQFGNTCAVQVHPGQDAQENGATRIVPASHEGPARKPDTSEVVPVEMPAGSVLLFSGRLYHGAGASISDRPRLGVAIDYIQPWLRPCEAHTLSADPAQVRLLPQRLQELLGFNQPSPYFGFVNGQHPREWLTKQPGS